MTAARDLLEAHGRTFCRELGIRLERNTPSPLFRWLTACILYTAPIQHDLATRGARALAAAGYTTAKAMAAAPWEARTRVLNENGYARYDERTATILGDASTHLVDAYRGDLRRLRAASGEDPGEMRKRLKAMKGVGDVAVDIFFREVQAVWPEVYPFADTMTLKAARRHKLGNDAEALARHVSAADFPRLLAALTRDELAR